MSDRSVYCLAVGALVGAFFAFSHPPLVIGVIVAVAVTRRSPVIGVLAVAFVAGSLASRSLEHLARPVPGLIEADAQLVTDPEWFSGALRADVQVGGRRYEAWFRGSAAGVASTRLAGERLRIEGSTRTDRTSTLAQVRHVAASLTVSSAEVTPGGPTLHRVANRLRRTYESGAAPMTPTMRTLFTGFVYGDERGQDPGVQYDFRATGLTHLLAVSGQNVAFVLALFGPLLRRLGLRGRLALSVIVLAQFAVLTRAEPSVLRATAMAGLSAGAATVGRPVAGARLLASAVTILVLIDPLLARSVGFGLSVAASAGILMWSGPIASRLPGPRVVADALAVTLAAQVAVAPLLLLVFGTVPLVSIPANLVVAPAAGPTMVWGLMAGLVAGLVPGLAGVLHVPTQILISYIAGVAKVCASLPIGDVDAAAALVIGLVVGVAIVFAKSSAMEWPSSTGRRWAAVALCGGLMLMAVLPRSGPENGTEVSTGARLFRAGPASVLVIDDPWLPGTMSALRRYGVREIDMVIVETSVSSDGLAALVDRFSVDEVVSAPRVTGDYSDGEALRLAHGRLEVVMTVAGRRLMVEVRTTAQSRPAGR